MYQGFTDSTTEAERARWETMQAVAARRAAQAGQAGTTQPAPVAIDRLSWALAMQRQQQDVTGWEVIG